MHTPQGFEMVDGVAFATSWWEIVFNPSMPYRFAHMMLASFLTVAFLVAGVSAFRWLIGDRRRSEVPAMLKTGVALGALLIPLQIYLGDLHGLNTKEHQPAKGRRDGGPVGDATRCAAGAFSAFPTKRRARIAWPSRSPASPRLS